ncbi:chalcone isomerase [Trichoderma longibrachiatum ATCC 18648]|uniref:Chalcone isomerase n=1 Tax=Trichoderma longibrachiatum ATCC 18648 TaxID=983965 RepID=A0A2T4BSR2_TRILO|nr:chalcone isomerase [Trichoderma longibrachiatum ATCC 18648]
MIRPTNLRPVLRSSPRCQQCLRRSLFSGKGSSRVSQDLDLNKLNSQRRDYERHRTIFLAAGATAGIISFIYTAWKLKKALAEQAEKQKDKAAVKCDAPPIPKETFKTEAGEKRKIVVHDEEGRVIVPTGNSVVPAFPRNIEVKLPSAEGDNSIAATISDKQGNEYTLVGLGVRTVTFIGIQVYMVGFYVATQDIAKLQHYLVKKINPTATTLIPSEKDALRKALRDATEGEETWDALLRDSDCRSVLRIVPVRDTDFHHLRDGFVRAIAARSQRNPAYNDETFGAAMKEFKALFNRGSVPKKQELLLCRDGKGALTVMFNSSRGKEEPKVELLGKVEDERLSRLLWLNYLAGSKVASEPARESIIEGVMEFVERPVGTVASQVV